MPAGSLPNIGPEARAQFLLALRARGVRDLDVLRALETVPREFFAPRRYADLAMRDIALPIPCGQTMAEPSLIARMIAALALRPTSRVLEIGSGSGYCAAIVARLARELVSVERYQSLAAGARARIADLGVPTVAVVWGDGLELPPEAGQFDRLVVHGTLDGLPPGLAARLEGEAVAVYGRDGPGGRTWLVRATRTRGGDWTESVIGASRLRVLARGRAQVL